MKIERIEDDVQQTWFTRGHVDLGDFNRAAKSHLHDRVFTTPAQHTYFRARPDRRSGHVYEVVNAPGRGAFPVTAISNAW